MDQKLKALKKKLFYSIFSLIVCAFMLTATSLAWFSSNKVVTSSGMSISADATANLVISDDLSAISERTYIKYGLSFTEGVRKFVPCTHDSDNLDFAETRLKYVGNTNAIDFVTGLKKENGDEINFMLAKNKDDGDKYYVERLLYIASGGKEMENATLTACISSAKIEDTEVSSGSLMATSVDFYLVEEDGDNFCGTSNVAEKSTVDIFTGTIPVNTDGVITVRIRCYFDGALLESEGLAYINASTIDVSKVALNIGFNA